jgi:arabinan endo-1,5-alpha-L-arabinosidase
MNKMTKYRNIFFSTSAMLMLSLSAEAQIGQPYIHDPSTIMECDGKYYTFGTGGGGLVSEDGWNWKSGAVRPGGGAAPDAIKIGDRYLIAYGNSGGGLGGGHNAHIFTIWNNTLDPASPQFKYTEPVEVAASDGLEDNDAIDPGLLLDPTSNKLWLSYGTYFGNVRLVELDPKTGQRMEGNKPIDIGIDCEATDLIYRDGWYYLLGTHGTCCDGINSTYNIVCGRSHSVTGPYMDNVGRTMLEGGGRMVIAANGRMVGPGHFGREVIDKGVEVMSCHFEADMDRSGRSVLGIRPLLWKNGWPVAGEPFKEGNYAIISERRGYALELSVDFVRMQQKQQYFWRIDPKEPVVSLPEQQLSDVIPTWPKGDIPVRIGDYMMRPHQLWTIKAVPEAGGYLGGQYYKIIIKGTQRALCATANTEVSTVPEFTGDASQLWRIEQLIDGTYRIMPKVIPGRQGLNTHYVLFSAADSTPTLEVYDFDSDNSKWNFK